MVQDFNLAGVSKEIIDEFPFFSFLLGDLHPHVLAMPFALLAMPHCNWREVRPVTIAGALVLPLGVAPAAANGDGYHTDPATRNGIKAPAEVCG